jgi:hypothetical protein
VEIEIEDYTGDDGYGNDSTEAMFLFTELEGYLSA